MNSFNVIGRLTKDPQVFNNADGSKKVKMTVAVKNNYKSKDGKVGTQFLPVEHFIAAGKSEGAYARIGQGDQVAISGEIRQNNWTDKNGEAHYDIVLEARTLEMLESKSVTDARKAGRAVAAADEADTVDAPIEEQ